MTTHGEKLLRQIYRVDHLPEGSISSAPTKMDPPESPQKTAKKQQHQHYHRRSSSDAPPKRRYALGDAACPSDVNIFQSIDEHVAAVEQLKKGDYCFTLRSDFSFTYARVLSQINGLLEIQVTDEGATKIIPRDHWKKYIRTLVCSHNQQRGDRRGHHDRRRSDYDEGTHHSEQQHHKEGKKLHRRRVTVDCSHRDELIRKSSMPPPPLPFPKTEYKRTVSNGSSNRVDDPLKRRNRCDPERSRKNRSNHEYRRPSTSIEVPKGRILRDDDDSSSVSSSSSLESLSKLLSQHSQNPSASRKSRKSPTKEDLEVSEQSLTGAFGDSIQIETLD